MTFIHKIRAFWNGQFIVRQLSFIFITMSKAIYWSKSKLFLKSNVFSSFIELCDIQRKGQSLNLLFWESRSDRSDSESFSIQFHLKIWTSSTKTPIVNLRFLSKVFKLLQVSLKEYNKIFNLFNLIEKWNGGINQHECVFNVSQNIFLFYNLILLQYKILIKIYFTQCAVVCPSLSHIRIKNVR